MGLECAAEELPTVIRILVMTPDDFAAEVIRGAFPDAELTTHRLKL